MFARLNEHEATTELSAPAAEAAESLAVPVIETPIEHASEDSNEVDVSPKSVELEVDAHVEVDEIQDPPVVEEPLKVPSKALSSKKRTPKKKEPAASEVPLATPGNLNDAEALHEAKLEIDTIFKKCSLEESGEVENSAEDQGDEGYDEQSWSEANENLDMQSPMGARLPPFHGKKTTFSSPLMSPKAVTKWTYEDFASPIEERRALGDVKGNQ